MHLLINIKKVEIIYFYDRLKYVKIVVENVFSDSLSFFFNMGVVVEYIFTKN